MPDPEPSQPLQANWDHEESPSFFVAQGGGRRTETVPRCRATDPCDATLSNHVLLNFLNG